ncbi:ketopantoate reductase family protein [Phaeospirillum tilakii]|uniref:2-dehydropantoate 2-reductase n=1 Tax=Phaeospirillum tilakii TaxID=741673 RepID=A0ABW5C9E6_9PROT
MPPIERVYICGLGAIGAIYAARLGETQGIEVRVVADPARIARYRRDGVSVNGRPLTVGYLRPDDAAPPADLILVAVKRHQLEAAVAAIHRFIGPGTIILSLLNGIDSEAVIADSLGLPPLPLAMVVAIDAVREGGAVRYSQPGVLVFGEPVATETPSPRIAALAALFERAGMPTRVPADMRRELWWKFMLNVGVNQLSAVLRAPYGTFQSVAEARDLVRLACREVVAVAAAEGIGLGENDIDSFFPVIDRLDPQMKTSMLQDVEAGRKTEVEMLGGTVVALGRRHGIPTPVNQTLFDLIRVIEQG